MNRLVIAFKALRQLGLQPVALNALYRFGLVTGHYRRAENREWGIGNSALRPLFAFPTPEDLLAVLGGKGKTSLLTEADEIVAGKVRLLGGEPVELKLTIPGNLEHWTAYETGKAPIPYSLITDLPAPDIKFIWEPARFGWAFTLGRAYHLTGDEKYAEAFWRYFETFTDANPPCLGPHWMSGQEVALRLMAFVWAAQVFDAASASTPERKARLAVSVAAHAARIPPTLAYARAQHNNHLLTEAAALLTAGLALPDHPNAPRWRGLGWRWLNDGLQSQIDSYGEYAQHSTNYHRLMLQLVLWTNVLVKNFDLRWPRQTLDAFRRSVHWLLSLMDSESGRTPNLGANDGAYIFPLTVLPFADYRPVLHAAARAFLDYYLPRGPWDEMALWFGAQAAGPRSIALPRYLGDQLYSKDSWAYLRTAQFTTRPSHADQLHLDLWWRGLNVAQDAGTYLYNAPAPWDNSLTTTLVHNTMAVNGRDQMTRAGRFLYLDWVNAYRTSLIAENPAMLQQVRGRYRGCGYRHTRIVSICNDDRWLVEDEILLLRMPCPVPRSGIGTTPLEPGLPRAKKLLTFRLHWLLPDWKWEIENGELGVMLRLASPHGLVLLSINHSPPSIPRSVSLFRAGETLHGSAGPDPVRGWASPAYGIKVPALSLAIEAESANEVKFATEFIFPK
ncbi:MAG: heparinase II/III family protein [Chloroflexi bacterium]|nr:heparinase II/III family protein [Chloroflexota bacterium]